MNLLDMRTVMFSYVISSLICAAVMALLWRQNRRRSPELGFWLADFIMQFMGVLLLVLRGNLPDFFTMVLSNILIVGGTWLLLIGLERYTSKTGRQGFNYIFMGAFFLVHMYFVYIQDSLQARTINNSLGVLVMCGQCAWLLLHRVDPALRKGTRSVGMVFGLFSLVSLIRIFVDLAAPQGNNLFKSGLYDTLGVLTYQMLYIWLTFALFLMVDRRLLTALERDIIEKDLVEAALKVSEEKFSIAFQNIPDAIVITSLHDGKIFEANASFFHITGYDKEESLGRTTVELNLWGNLAQRNEMVVALQKQGRFLNLETDFRKKSGELFSGSISSELIQLQGQTCVLNVIHDITERKQAEATLKASENRFHTLFEQAAVGVALIDTKTGHYLDINQSYCDFLGYTKEEMLNLSFQDVTHPDDVKENIENNALLLTGKIREFSIEKRYLRKDGRIVWGNLTASPLWAPGEKVNDFLHIAVLQDITERKQAEEALLKSAASLQAVLHSTADGIMAVSSENEVLYANERFAEMWQIPQAVMASKDDSILLHHVLDQLSDPESFLKEVQELYKSTKESFDMLNFKDGRVFERLSRPLMQGAVVRGRVWSFRDITARKQDEKLQNAIYRISRAADQAKNLDSLFPSIHAIIQEVMAAGNFYIALYDEKNDLLSFPYSVDEQDPHFPPKKPGKGLTEYVLRTGRSVLCDEALYQGLIQCAEIELVGAHSPIWLGAPLIVEGKAIGVMVVQDYKNARAYGERELHMLEFVSTQVALAIERKRLEEEIRSLSLTDELTGLYNRRGFTLLAEQEVKKAYRIKRSMLLLFADVDYLKTINDTWGHAQGDLVLQEVSVILKESLRETDILARFGGDEFVVLAVDASKESAEIMTNRLRTALEARNQQGEKSYQLTLSIGVARYDPEDPCTVSELITQADGRMYEQKQARKGKRYIFEGK